MSFIGDALKGLFGGAERRIARFSPTGFSSPGLSGRYDQGSNRFILTRSPEAEQALSGLRSQFSGLSSEIGDLRPLVRPGFGELTRTLVQSIRNAASRSVGNLREELSKRRVAGSSFARNEIASRQADFDQAESELRAQSFLQEFELTRQLIGEQFGASIQSIQSILEQLNLESGLAAGLSETASRLLQASTQAQGEARAAADAGIGELAGTIASAFLIFSDRRLKRNIHRIGTVSGYPWYEFDYVWGEHAEGVMADEIPSQFVYRLNGYDCVKYHEVFTNG